MRFINYSTKKIGLHVLFICLICHSFGSEKKDVPDKILDTSRFVEEVTSHPIRTIGAGISGAMKEPINQESEAYQNASELGKLGSWFVDDQLANLQIAGNEKMVKGAAKGISDEFKK